MQRLEDKLNFTNHEIAEFGILRGRKKANNRITTLDLRKAVFGLVRRPAWKNPVAHSPEERSR